MIVAWSWQQTGLSMVIFLAGLTTIPEDLLEVCEIEGATTAQRIRLVVIPLLTPRHGGGDRAQRDQLAQGLRHPVHHDRRRTFNSSDTLAMHMYNESFKKYLMGYGSAISVVLFLIALTIIRIYFRQLRKVDRLHG